MLDSKTFFERKKTLGGERSWDPGVRKSMFFVIKNMFFDIKKKNLNWSQDLRPWHMYSWYNFLLQKFYFSKSAVKETINFLWPCTCTCRLAALPSPAVTRSPPLLQVPIPWSWRSPSLKPSAWPSPQESTPGDRIRKVFAALPIAQAFKLGEEVPPLRN